MMHTLKSSPIDFLMHNDDLAYFCCLVSRVFYYHTHLVCCSTYQVNVRTYKGSLNPQESPNKISGNVLVPRAV